MPVAPNFVSLNTRLLLVVVRPAMPVPVSVTCCGLVVELSTTASEAGCAPTALGENEIPSVQCVPCASVMGSGPQVPVPLRAYSGSEGVAGETGSVLVLPLLVTVPVVLVEVCPTAVLAKASDAVTDIEVVGVAVAVAVAVS